MEDPSNEVFSLQNDLPEEWTLIVLLIVGIYLIVMAFVITAMDESNNKTTLDNNMSTQKNDTTSIPQLFGISTALFVLLIFVGAIVILAIIFLAIRITEQKVLFVPHKTQMYRKIGGNWIQLRSGGGLLHCTPHANPNSRPLLFLHGNTGNLDLYEAALKRCARLGYNMYALEYAGYGLAAGNEKVIPNCDSVLQDVLESWNVCGSEHAIIMGFSLGGAILGKTYDRLNPMPAQIVFLNTFHSLSGLVESKLKVLGPLITPFLKTQWSTQPPRFYYNNVLIVYTKDDDVVTPEQGKELKTIFQSLNPVVVELPDGGHRYSTIRHLDRWANNECLLPPFINSG